MSGADGWDTILRALEDRTRRRVLVALLELPRDETVTVPEDVRRGDQDVANLRTALYHYHLPLLEAAGYVRWDNGSNQVGVGDSFEEIRPVLRLLHDNRDRLPDDWT